MSAAISGMGWVTPLGTGLTEVWQRLMAGEHAQTAEVLNPQTGRTYRCCQVDPKLVEQLGRRPRLRRSSAISYFTAAAGLAALENAGLAPGESQRIALIFSVASGGVAYTRRFYEKVASEGAGAASPLLFPETVYNAPASHLASVLGINGATYTLVGDASTGIAALHQAEQLLRADQADHCVVVGGEELDWVLCEAYRQWRLVAADGPTQVYAKRPAGMVMAEAGAAVVVSREGRVRLERVDEGVPFHARAEAAGALREVLGRVTEAPQIVIGSANGTFIDEAERAAIRACAPEASVYAPKAAFGEALGASALLQVICGALALERGELPPTEGPFDQLEAKSRTGLSARRALVSVLGLNQQASAAMLARD